LVPPAFAMWLPNLLLVALGLFAMRRVRRDRSLFEGRALDAATAFLGGLLPRRETAAPGPSGRQGDEAASPRVGVTRAWLVDRYVATRFLQLFVLVLASIISLYVLIEYLDISTHIARVRPPASAILGFFQAKLAPILVDVVPMAFAAAALITVAGLVRSSESTALLAHGISLIRSTASILVLAVVAGGALFLFAERVVPEAASEAERLRNVLLGKPPAASSDALRSYLKGDSGRFFSAETWDAGSSSVTGVAVFQVDPETLQLVRKSFGARGVIVPGKGIQLEDGWTRTFSETGGSLFLRQAGTVFIDAPEAGRTFQAGRADPRQMDSFELARFVRLRRQAGADVAAISTGLYQKSSVALTPLLLTLVGLPFAFRFGKRGAVAGIGVALLLALVYLVLDAALGKAGQTGSLPPLLAAWGTNLFFSLGAGWGLLGIRT
ncbi:MAG: LptF/LptG family permease, partial [Thermoanaerobaculia bacterium]|nr:LptF/LptG family permease [Thermoanaerobaculia bacterium]